MSDIDALLEQSQWDPFWLPSGVTIVDRPRLRYTHTGRDQHALNQVTRVRASVGEDDYWQGIVDEVSRAHQGVTSRWLLARDSQHPGLLPHLQAGGWTREHVHHVRSVSSATDLSGNRQGVAVVPVDSVARLTDCIRTREAAFSMPASALSSDRLADELGTLAGGRVHRFVALDAATQQPMASGGLNTFPALGLGFLWGGGTHPDHRGRGAYRALLAARLACAHARGCPVVAVYAREGTSDPIVAALGFARAGTMVTWVRPAR